MAEIGKEQAITILQRYIGSINELKQSWMGSPAFDKWMRNVKLAIGRIFGELSEHVHEFMQTKYEPDYESASNETYQRYYVSGLMRAQALLEAMVEEIQDYWPDDARKSKEFQAIPEAASAEAKTESRVFIGHGHSKLWARLKIFLEDELGLKTITYESESRVGESIVPILEKMLAQATFAVLVLTAEDETAQGSKRARQNVVHEAGLFQGRLGFRRAIVLRQEGLEDFSNVAGLQYISFRADKIEEAFYELQRVLKREGMI